MKAIKNVAICAGLFVMCLFIAIGYAAVTDILSISGSANVTPPMPDVYITNVTPNSSAGVTVKTTNGTVMIASVNGGGTATFTIDVINISNTPYVFDRVIDDVETDFEGVYSGTEITYQLSGISRLDEIATNGGTLSFDISITVPEGVSAEYYILKFNFISKYGIPSEDYFPEDMPDKEVSLVQRLSDILNNIYVTSKTGDLDSRTYLIDKAIQDRWEGVGDPYVGTMTKDYIEPLENLFGDIFRDESVKFILKNQDINKDGYNEISMYSTSDPLTNETEDLRGVVCVYVTVFTPVIDEQYNIIGYNMVCEAMRGYCYEVNYGSGNTKPSFSTDEWKNDVGYVVRWETSGPVLGEIVEGADGYDKDWNPFDKHQYSSYNGGYITWNIEWNCYANHNTVPYGQTVGQCLADKIPNLQ